MALSSWQLIEINATVIVGLLFLFTFQMVSGPEVITKIQKELEDARKLYENVEFNQKLVHSLNCKEIVKADYEAEANAHPETLSEMRRLCVQKVAETILIVGSLQEKYSNVVHNIEGFDIDEPISESVRIPTRIRSDATLPSFIINSMTNFLLVPFAVSAAYEVIYAKRYNLIRNKENQNEDQASNIGVVFLIGGFIFLAVVLSTAGIMRIFL